MASPPTAEQAGLATDALASGQPTAALFAGVEEMRSPLATIAGAAAALRLRVREEDRAALIDTIDSSTARLVGLITRLLPVTRR